MANISQITLPNNVTYDIVDKGARDLIALGIELITVQQLPTASKSTMGKIYLVPLDDTEQDNIFDEYITVEKEVSGVKSYSWELIGTTKVDLSDYSKKTHTHTVTSNVTITGAEYTPQGTVTSTFAGDSLESKGNNTPQGTVTSSFSGTQATISSTGSVTGNVSAPAISVKDSTSTDIDLYSMSSSGSYTASQWTDGSYTASSFTAGTTPHTYGFTVSNEILTVSDVTGTAPSYTAEQVTMPTYTKESVTLPSRTKATVTASAPTFSNGSASVSGTYTPAGGVTSTFSGTEAEYTVSGTPTGTITSTFAGTKETITPTLTNNQVTTSQASE
ncbi:MAG: hypothetical protein KBT03_06545 [Bacteroidales bacterium]|nr:hypothetical protein [Candidatus Scybalousia scybalohippi]